MKTFFTYLRVQEFIGLSSFVISENEAAERRCLPVWMFTVVQFDGRSDTFVCFVSTVAYVE